MKTMKTIKIITSILLIVVAISAMGCGNDPVAPQRNVPTDPTPPIDPPDPGDGVSRQLVGFWVFVDARVDGGSSALADVLDWESGTVIAAFLIEADGYYEYGEFNDDIEMIHSSEGSVTTSGARFSIQTSDLSYSGTWVRAGDTLTLSATIEGSKVDLVAEYVDPEQSVVSIAR